MKRRAKRDDGGIVLCIFEEPRLPAKRLTRWMRDYRNEVTRVEEKWQGWENGTVGDVTEAVDGER